MALRGGCWLTALTVLVALLPGLDARRAVGACGTPKVSDNVLYRLSYDASEAKFSCRRRFSLIGNKKAVCKYGRWHGASPICIGSGCPVVKPMTNGYIVYKYGGRMVSFSCVDDSVLQGPSLLICNGRNWNGTQPNCTDVSKPRAIKRHFKRSHGDDEDGKTHSDWLLEADYSCISNRRRIPPPNVNRSVKVTKWTHVKGKNRLYTVYVCRWGYAPDRKRNKLYCINGQWKGSTPVCYPFNRNEAVNRLQSDQPRHKSHDDWLRLADYSCLAGGRVAPLVTNAIRLTRYAILEGKPHLYAQYRCKAGYRLVQADRKFLYCTQNRWTGDMPRCTPGVSSSPSALHIPDKYKYGAVVQKPKGWEANKHDYSASRQVAPSPSYSQPRVRENSSARNDNQRPAARWRNRDADGRRTRITSRQPNRYRTAYPTTTSAPTKRRTEASGQRGREEPRPRSNYGRRYRNEPAVKQTTSGSVTCARQNGGCEQLCSERYGRQRCSCRRGYRLDRDGKSCTDVDECAVRNGGCHHTCVKTPASHRCTCRPGYTLQADTRSCARTPLRPPVSATRWSAARRSYGPQTRSRTPAASRSYGPQSRPYTPVSVPRRYGPQSRSYSPTSPSSPRRYGPQPRTLTSVSSTVSRRYGPQPRTQTPVSPSVSRRYGTQKRTPTPVSSAVSRRYGPQPMTQTPVSPVVSRRYGPQLMTRAPVSSTVQRRYPPPPRRHTSASSTAPRRHGPATRLNSIRHDGRTNRHRDGRPSPQRIPPPNQAPRHRRAPANNSQKSARPANNIRRKAWRRDW